MEAKEISLIIPTKCCFFSNIIFYIFFTNTPLSTLYNSLILKGLKFNNFLAKNCKPSIYRALEKRVESQVTNTH